MKLAVQLLTFSALLFVVDSSSVDGSPLNKVVEMLQGMITKGKAMKIQERVEFSKFSEYCDGTRKETTEAIATGADQIVQQKADIGKALSDAEELAEEIKDGQAEGNRMDAELAGAQKLRKKERADYEATHKDFTESITAIGKATEVIKSKAKDVPQSLIQLSMFENIPAEAKAAITSFVAVSSAVQENEDGPPKANAYESQTGGVIAILEKLKLKFEDQRTELEKEESSTKANFELLEQKLTDSIKDNKSTVADKTAAKAKRQEVASQTKGDLDVTTRGKASDEKKLTDLNVECDGKAQEYDQNQVMRAAEIKAMETATGILGSDEVSGTAKKNNLAAALVDDGATSLVQLFSHSQENDKRRALATFLQHRANSLNSKYLSLVAARALTDPMGKVKKMIKDLIVKLMEEANAEADQKGYCDSELATNKVTRDGKTNDVDELTANVEKLTSDLSKMAEDSKTLSKEISDLRAEQSKATDLRNEEKGLNSQTISEAKSAQLAVERATQVLKDFYGKASGAALLQDSDSVSDDMEEVTSAPYKGMQGMKGGVIGFLETVLSDFARLESATTSAEDEAATKYQKFMDSSTQDIEVKGVEVDHLEKKSQNTDESIRNLKKELKATQEELDAALEYYEKLRPDCVDTGASYKDRVEMRQAEIQSLQEALQTLSEN